MIGTSLELAALAQVPDWVNARINGKPASDVIADSTEWFENSFTPKARTRHLWRGQLPYGELQPVRVASLDSGAELHSLPGLEH